ncbi:hypothetical protein ABEU98_26385 [Priestia megaterium]|uniref:hypothetical protein n=1 Tax=Priestia TaxID=2800373 RepID=UPI0009DF169B|nr:hypothetical protein [Priestia megaterium]RFB32418.1 hypothetical protein DZB86_30205 [Bacillus sp. RC]MBW0933706.1 hypothetical protein [Priestia megaterium]MDN3232855.1 hypothetical protein [Priestia megaterium]PFJ49575.1 hypothetical protein COJ00_00385 [Priestia megaterium]PFK68625.1 hypothetical protein COJ21_23320 [Priestia megaterium]
MKEKELQEVNQRLENLFKDLLEGKLTKDEFYVLSDNLYKRQTRLRYEIEYENGQYYRNYFNL